MQKITFIKKKNIYLLYYKIYNNYIYYFKKKKKYIFLSSHPISFFFINPLYFSISIPSILHPFSNNILHHPPIFFLSSYLIFHPRPRIYYRAPSTIRPTIAPVHLPSSPLLHNPPSYYVHSFSTHTPTLPPIFHPNPDPPFISFFFQLYIIFN